MTHGPRRTAGPDGAGRSIRPFSFPGNAIGRRTALRTAGLLLPGLLLLTGCNGTVPPLPEVPLARQTQPPPERPSPCRDVAAGEALAPLLAAARPGDSFCLAPGAHPAPLEIGAGVTVWGPREAVVHTSGSGDTIRISGADAALLGLTVDGSGSRFDLQEAAVHAVSADRARILGVRIEHALFGVIVEKSRGVVLAGNEILGGHRDQIGLRGDSIRVWETHGSRIEANFVSGARDIVIWYSSDNDVTGNEVVDGRYGTHFMYSHGNRVTGNRYVGNVVGIFAMYSRDLTIDGNLLAASAGAAGIGLGLKESSRVTVRDNAFVKNTMGIYFDNSPFEPGSTNEISGNAIRLCDVGVGFHSSTDANSFRANSLRGNAIQVRVDGGGDATGNLWHGNDFDDYAGYDLDGDGVGDVAYELRSFSGSLRAAHPQLDYLRGSPSLFLVDAASRILPIHRPTAILVDPAPQAGRTRPGDARAH